MKGKPLAVATWLGLVAVFAGFHPQGVHGQGLREMALTCGGGSETLLAWCHETALAVQAAQGAFGLAASGGTDTPGSASTMGWRLKGSPRLALSARVSLTRATMPDLFGGNALPRGEETFNLPSGHLLASLGLFDGFSLAPTMGGILSIDLTGSFHAISAPKGEGFHDGLRGWGAGVRLGVLRESFTLPGITLSASHRRLGEVRLGSQSDGDPAESAFDVSVSSLRGVVGKDFFGLGLLAGIGWDRYGGDVDVSVMDPAPALPPGAEVGRATGDPTSERRLYFLGGGMTFVVFQVSAEVGWAEGFDPNLPERGEATFDPASRSLFGSIAFRLTF